MDTQENTCDEKTYAITKMFDATKMFESIAVCANCGVHNTDLIQICDTTDSVQNVDSKFTSGCVCCITCYETNASFQDVLDTTNMKRRCRLCPKTCEQLFQYYEKCNAIKYSNLMQRKIINSRKFYSLGNPKPMEHMHKIKGALAYANASLQEAGVEITKLETEKNNFIIKIKHLKEMHVAKQAELMDQIKQNVGNAANNIHIMEDVCAPSALPDQEMSEMSNALSEAINEAIQRGVDAELPDVNELLRTLSSDDSDDTNYLNIDQLEDIFQFNCAEDTNTFDNEPSITTFDAPGYDSVSETSSSRKRGRKPLAKAPYVQAKIRKITNEAMQQRFNRYMAIEGNTEGSFWEHLNLQAKNARHRRKQHQKDEQMMRTLTGKVEHLKEMHAQALSKKNKTLQNLQSTLNNIKHDIQNLYKAAVLQGEVLDIDKFERQYTHLAYVMKQ